MVLPQQAGNTLDASCLSGNDEELQTQCVSVCLDVSVQLHKLGTGGLRRVRAAGPSADLWP